MNNFIFALNTTLPIFLVIALGKLFMKYNIFNREWTKVTDKFAFTIALPLVLFRSVAKMSAPGRDELKFFIFCIVSTTVIFATIWFLSYRFLKDRKMVGSFTQGAARSSAAVLGIPFAMNIFGNVGVIPLMILAVVPLFNAYSVIILECSKSTLFENEGTLRLKGDLKLEEYRQKKGPGKKIDFGQIIKNIIKNPLIIGILLGFPFCIFNIKIPYIFDKTMGYVAQTAVPLMLLSLGAEFSMKDLTAKFRPALAAAAIKLLILPAIFLPLAAYMGFRDSYILAILIMSGSPSAISGYVMSKMMKNDYVLMSNIIILSTLMASVTFTLWVFVLRMFSLI